MTYLTKLYSVIKYTNGSIASPLFPILISVGLTACTLDFSEFEPYTTPEGYQGGDAPVDMEIEQDMVIPEDMIIPEDMDMMPPPLLDGDDDGVSDEEDNCPQVPNPDQFDTDSDGKGDYCDDDDEDTILDHLPDGMGGSRQNDNCLGVPNINQSDIDLDGTGDACDDDIDGDLLNLEQEQALGTDPSVADSDSDGLIDSADHCPLIPSTGLDLDADGLGDACDLDDDADGIFDWIDACPRHADPDQAATPEEAQAGRGSACALDFDADGVIDSDDPCPLLPLSPINGQERCVEAPLVWGFDADILDLGSDNEYLWAASTGGLSRFSFNAVNDQLDPESEQRIEVIDGLWSSQAQRIEPMYVLGPNRLTIRGAWVMNGDRLSALRYDGQTSKYFGIEVDLSEFGPSQLYDLVSYEQGALVGTDVGLFRVSYNAVEEITLGEEVAPSVTALAYLETEQQVWIATGASLYSTKIDQLEQIMPIALFENVNTITHIHPINATEIIILTDTEVIGYSAITQEESMPRLSVEAVDVLVRKAGMYLATPSGLIWATPGGELTPPAIGSIGGTEVTALESRDPLAPDASLLVGSRSQGEGTTHPDSKMNTGGIRAGEAVWFTRQLEEQSCFVETLMMDDQGLLVGTDSGLYQRTKDGSQTLLYERPVYGLTSLSQWAWVATTTDLLRVPLAGGEAIVEIQPALTPPFTAIFASDGYLWVGAQDGVARGVISLETGTVSGWQTYLSVDEIGLPSGEVVAFGEETNTTWVAVRGADGGIARFTDGAFQDVPLGTNNGLLPSNFITDMEVNLNRVVVSTEGGLSIFKPVFTNQNDFLTLYNGSGLPIEAGTSHLLSVLDTGRTLWGATAPTPIHPYGGLISLDVSDPDSPLRTPNSERFYPADQLDILVSQLPDTPHFGRAHARFSAYYDQNQVHVMFSTCGDAMSPGIIGILDGHRSLEQNVAERRLPGRDEGVLLPSPRGHVMFASTYGELTTPDGAPTPDGVVQTVDLYHPLLEGEEWPEEQEPLRLKINSDQLNRPLRACRAHQQNGEDLKRLLCFAEGNYLVRHIMNTWSIDDSPLLNDENLVIYDFLLDPDNAANAAWIGTASGLISLRNNTPTVLTNANTNSGLANDKIRALAWNRDQRRLYVGTDQGLVSLDASSALPPNLAQTSWEVVHPEIAALRTRITALAMGPDNTLWVAIKGGVIHLKDDIVERYTVGPDLPSGDIYSIALSQGAVFVSHSSGISRYLDGTWKHYSQREGVSSPRGALEVDDRGYVWTLTPQGAIGFSPTR